MRKPQGRHAVPTAPLPPTVKRLAARILPFAMLGTAAAASTAAAPADAAVTHAVSDTGPLPKVVVQKADIKHKAVRVTHRRTRKSVTVVPGDTLSGIAAAKCHHASDWPSLYAANRPVVGADPNLIFPGEHLSIACHHPALAAVQQAVAPEHAAVTAKPRGRHHKPEAHQNAGPLRADTWHGYGNPFRSISGFAWERVDSGVDFGGTGPLYALGPAVITNVYNAGWPGGVFISYRMLSGPLVGRYIYFAESIRPEVQVGQHVDHNTVIGEQVGGIEVGFAEPPGSGNPLEGYSGYPTGAGNEMHALLAQVTSLGFGHKARHHKRHHKHHHLRVRGVLSCKNLGHPAEQNVASMWDYFTGHGLTPTGAAAVIGSINGESGGNPESVGSGGGGLIGWTPLPGGYVTGSPGRDLAVQEAAVVSYIDTYGSRANVNGAGDVAAALTNFVYHYERPADPAGQSAARIPAALAAYADCAG